MVIKIIFMVLVAIMAAVALIISPKREGTMKKTRAKAKAPAKKKNAQPMPQKTQGKKKTLEGLIAGSVKAEKRNEDFKTGMLSDEIKDEADKRLEEEFLKTSGMLSDEDTDYAEDERSEGVFSRSERTALLEEIVDEGESEEEGAYHTQVLMGDDEAYEEPFAPTEAPVEELFTEVEEVVPEESVEEVSTNEEPYQEDTQEEIYNEEVEEVEEEDESQTEKQEAEETYEEPESYNEEADQTESEDGPKGFYAFQRLNSLNYGDKELVGVLSKDCKIENSSFLGSSFEEPVAIGSSVTNSRFKYAELKNGYIIKTVFKNCNFCKATFENMVLDNVQFINCLFDKRTEFENVTCKEVEIINGSVTHQVNGEDISQTIEKIYK